MGSVIPSDWKTPFDNGMKCSTCKHWHLDHEAANASDDAAGDCGKIKYNDRSYDNFPLAVIADGHRLSTLGRFSCSYWDDGK